MDDHVDHDGEDGPEGSGAVVTWSAVDVEEQIYVVFKRLDDEVYGLDVLAQAAAHSRHNYEMSNAMQWMRLADTKATEQIKKAMVMSAVGPLKLAAELAEGQVEAKRAVIRSLHVQADLLRSLMATARKYQEGEIQ